MCLISDKIQDPSNFYTTPGLSWIAALKMTGVELELLTEQEIIVLPTLYQFTLHFYLDVGLCKFNRCCKISKDRTFFKK